MAGGVLSKFKFLDPVQSLTPGIGRKLDVLQIANKPKTDAQSVPAAPVAPALPPERSDPAVSAAASKARAEELRRRGRRATILSGGAGIPDPAALGRPSATSGAASSALTLGG